MNVVHSCLDCRYRQQGQALLEALVVTLTLASLWVAVHWLAHYQDAALSATHASRHQAFSASRGERDSDADAVMESFFSGPAHRWTDRRGESILKDSAALRLSQVRQSPLSDRAQPGLHQADARVLRHEWGVEDTGILRAAVHVDFGAHEAAGESLKPSRNLLGLHVFDLPYPGLTRSISILTDSGHAASDVAVQSRVGSSALAWATAQARSRTLATDVAVRAGGVDTAWRRPDVKLDWLQPWSGQVPPQVLTHHPSIEGRN